MNSRFVWCLLLALSGSSAAMGAATGENRFPVIDASDPFYPGRDFPKLTTPQWLGEDGVEAVVILAIDDMRANEPRYETMLRPILDRLKRIDGRAAASIMVNTFAPTNMPQLQSWLREGVSLECHSIAHPCPLCQGGDFSIAVTNYHSCVDLLGSIPGHKPVAFRMPCCDSMNSPTPRFYEEIFNHTSSRTNFLTIDSSVMVILTPNDPALPKELVVDRDGKERFRKYLPAETNAITRLSMGSFTTTIEDYPYPYVLGGLCWEFPCIVPSDWEANNLHKPNNPQTVEDWKRALDAVVLKQGTMTFIFHPHGWIRNEQMVEFIDYAASHYGKRVKFLNFREAQERLDKHLLAGRPLRKRDGGDNGVRLADVNHDGYLDVVSLGTENGKPQRTRLWNRDARQWIEIPAPARAAAAAKAGPAVAQFGIVDHGDTCLLTQSGAKFSAFRFRDGAWQEDNTLLPPLAGLVGAVADAVDQGLRLRDIDNDGVSELIVSNDRQNSIFKYDSMARAWKPMPYALPEGTRIVDGQGNDAGLRFVDVDRDGFDDILFSNEERYSLHLFRKDDRKLRLKPGWSDEIISGTRSNPLTDPIPPIVRAGPARNNGVWFARGSMWIQNENTAPLPDRMDRRSLKQLLSGFLPGPLSPEESLKSLRVHPGFDVQLVAAEPLIADPISFQWSADGRLWVVEMGDYPLGVDASGRPGGRVRVLEDTDGDGVYDHATTFLEGLNFPTGLHPWRNGVVISGAPEIFYAEDAAGSGKATIRETLFAGFAEGNQQHRVNGFDYGLDGWLYAANGDSGGNVRAAGTIDGRVAINLRGHDLRIHPDKRLIETVAGQTQYGRHRDDWDNWFGNNNPTWPWHYYFPEHYLARNPYLPVKSLKKTLANYAESTRCFPQSRTISRFNDPFAANHVTSGCSSTPYRDNLFGPSYEHAVFICEPVHNLVHCEVLTPEGVTFTSRRSADESNSEFLASTDNWFRPVFARTGPDGALYIADMYRLVIEHPEWIPIEMQRRLDLRAGADKGRIYRIAPHGAILRRTPNLARMKSAELAEALDSSNGWQRDTAQRLLLERNDRSVAARLEQIAQHAESPKTRVQALWTLHGLGMLTPAALRSALKDGDAHVREHAVRLSEPMLSDLLGDVLRLASEDAVRVRYQVAFTLGQTMDAKAAPALLRLAADPDENVRNAAMSSMAPYARTLQALVAAGGEPKSLMPMLKKLIDKTTSVPASLIERTNAISAEQRQEREAVVARYASAATLHGDPKSGRALFEQNCALCHRHRGLGNEVGPDLGIMTGKAVEQVIVAILDPNAAVEDRFRSYSVRTKDDRDLTGVIVAETPTSLTIRAPNQGDETVLRSELVEMTASGLSLMPEGFENAFTPQQLADLVAFVLGK